MDDGEVMGLRPVDGAGVTTGVLQTDVVKDQVEVGAAVPAQAMLDGNLVAQSVGDFCAVGKGRGDSVVVQLTSPNGVVDL